MTRESRSSCVKSVLSAGSRAVGGWLALGLVPLPSSRDAGTVPVIRPSGNTLAATFKPAWHRRSGFYCRIMTQSFLRLADWKEKNQGVGGLEVFAGAVMLALPPTLKTPLNITHPICSMPAASTDLS